VLSPSVVRTAHVRPFRLSFDELGKVNLRLETIATSGNAQPTLEVLAATLQPCSIMGLLGLEARVGITKVWKMYVGLKCMKRGREYDDRKEGFLEESNKQAKDQMASRKKNNRAAGGCIWVVMRTCQYILLVDHILPIAFGLRLDLSLTQFGHTRTDFLFSKYELWFVDQFRTLNQ
jgi:hypothetical protein